MAEISFPSVAHPSLDDIPSEVEATSILRKLYPKDLFPSPNTVRLPLGKTTYWVFGPVDGPKVALIHGIATPSPIWKHVAPVLADNGFRVLVYDLYGRGYSEAPDCAYDTNLYITQLALLLQYVQFPRAHIIGLSMGGGIAAAFAAMFPHLVLGKVVLIASAGLMELPESPPPVLPLPANPGFMRDLRTLQTECLPGFPHALASSLRVGPLRGLENAYISISEKPEIKVQIVHGTDDKTVPMKYGLKIKNLLPKAELVPIEGADHDLVVAIDHHKSVETAILRFLKD